MPFGFPALAMAFILTMRYQPDVAPNYSAFLCIINGNVMLHTLIICTEPLVYFVGLFKIFVGLFMTNAC